MTQMTLGQAIRNAITAELAAERFYRLLADSTTDLDSRDFLQKMAEQEKEHADGVLSVAHRLEAGSLPSRPDDNVEGIETALEWADTENIDYDTAIALAINLEDQAALYYDALSSSTDGVVAEFFAELAAQEEKHAIILKTKYSGD